MESPSNPRRWTPRCELVLGSIAQPLNSAGAYAHPGEKRRLRAFRWLKGAHRVRSRVESTVQGERSGQGRALTQTESAPRTAERISQAGSYKVLGRKSIQFCNNLSDRNGRDARKRRRA